MTEDMHHHLVPLLQHLLLFFGIAGLAVPLLQRLRLSSILGYLLCGVIVGPYGLGQWSGDYPWLQLFVVNDQETVQLLGELGIATLLFMIGLEMSFKRLRELRRYVLGLGNAQIVISAAAIGLVAYYFGNSLEMSILLGASLALSSTAVVMHVLHESNQLQRPIGTLCFSILLMQDLAVVPILILVTAFAGAGEGSISENLVYSLGVAVLAVSGIYILGRRALRMMLRAVSFTHNPEWLIAFALLLLVGFSYITFLSGLSLGLGAFLAGLLIADTEFRHEIEVIIEPLKSLLLGIFFLSVGMMIDVGAVFDTPFWIAFSVVGIMGLKAGVLYPLCRLFGSTRELSLRAAAYLAQPGEFGLLILSVAMSQQMIPAADGQFFLLVTAIALLLTPLIMHAAPWLTRVAGVGTPPPDLAKAQERVVVVGCGRVGQLVADLLEWAEQPYIAIEQDAQRISWLRQNGYHVVLGDARRPALWRHLDVANAKAIVIASDAPKTSQEIARIVKQTWPQVPVIARAADDSTSQRMQHLGVEELVSETLSLSVQLAQRLLRRLGMAKDKTSRQTLERVLMPGSGLME